MAELPTDIGSEDAILFLGVCVALGRVELYGEMVGMRWVGIMSRCCQKWLVF